MAGVASAASAGRMDRFESRSSEHQTLTEKEEEERRRNPSNNAAVNDKVG